MPGVRHGQRTAGPRPERDVAAPRCPDLVPQAEPITRPRTVTPTATASQADEQYLVPLRCHLGVVTLSAGITA